MKKVIIVLLALMTFTEFVCTHDCPLKRRCPDKIIIN